MNARPQTSANTPFPRFQLYGEADSFADPGFVHIESIASRSRSHDWEIRPHRHETLDQLLVIRSGRMEVRIEADLHSHAGPAIVHVPANIVHGFRFGDEVDGDVLTFSAELRGALRSSAAGDPGLVGGALVLTPAVDLLARLAPLVEQLRMECSGHEQDRITAAEWLVGLLLLQVGRVAVDAGDDGSAVSGRPQRFRDLVDRHFREHRPIAFYAAALAMTERSLTRLCRARFHCSPMHYVHRRLLLEAQRQLTYGSTSIARIAEDLGFADPSYFTRFYRRMTGKLPSTARRQAL
ncbi:helix-turn-helix domain-containing protein [uncultured Sphingomonas sp.]|uniref:helix-turn-helix domain-containing protein n=1 Tax=uncultured Sphingomonas sp. TaxID=158754 RepID=UPI002637095A|nr:helix-turn-helix domain-containing protein [uncultured Sphingomonas sp.]